MKIAFYFNHIESLGHTVRTLCLAEGLKREIKGSEVLVLQGGIPQNFLKKSGDIVIANVPKPFTSKKWFHSGISDAGIKFEDALERVSFMKKKIDGFRPDIFITEFFPFGREIEKFELLPLIKYIRKNTSAKVVCSAGYPLLSLEEDMLKGILADFDMVFMHCVKELDLSELKKIMGGGYSALMEELDKKMAFTGYVFDKKIKCAKEAVRKKYKAGKRKIVLVSRGGSNVMPGIVYKSILAARILGEEYIFIVIAGPSTTRLEMETMKRLASKSKNVRIALYEENFYDLLNACDVSLSLAGYNTACELMKLGKKAVVIPYYRSRHPEQVEQYYRAKILEKVIGSCTILPEQATAKNIANAVREKACESGNAPRVKNEWFGGIKKTARLMEKMK